MKQQIIFVLAASVWFCPVHSLMASEENIQEENTTRCEQTNEVSPLHIFSNAARLKQAVNNDSELSLFMGAELGSPQQTEICRRALGRHVHGR